MGTFGAQVSRFAATKAESFLNAFFMLFGREFSDFDNVDVHGIRVLSFDRSGERLVGLMGRFGVLFGDFVGMLPLGLEGDGILIPVIDGGGDCVHGHDMAHEGERDTGREISNSVMPVREE